jgi:hypothetical protein
LLVFGIVILIIFLHLKFIAFFQQLLKKSLCRFVMNGTTGTGVLIKRNS